MLEDNHVFETMQAYKELIEYDHLQFHSPDSLEKELSWAESTRCGRLTRRPWTMPKNWPTMTSESCADDAAGFASSIRRCPYHGCCVRRVID